MLLAADSGAFVSLLDRGGESLDSVAFSGFLEERRRSGRDLCFVVGGPFGLQLDVGEVDHRLSLGEITLPHQLARAAAIATVPHQNEPVMNTDEAASRNLSRSRSPSIAKT